MTPAAVVPQARLAKPAQSQCAVARRLLRNVELDRFWRICFRDELMNFDFAIGNKANFSIRNITRIDDTKSVTRPTVESRVTQRERLVIERRRVVPPGDAPVLVTKIDQG